MEQAKELAAAVIMRALRYLSESGCKDVEALEFLLGHTEISQFWFKAAGIDHLSPKEIGTKIRQWRESEIRNRRRKGNSRYKDIFG